MKNAPVLFLSLIFCVTLAAQDLPDDILADQYLLQATQALENDDPQGALRAFEKIETLDVEPPPEFLFFYGKLLVENSALLADLTKGQSFLKQYVLSIEKGSDHYRSALELLLMVEGRVSEAYEAEKQQKRELAEAERERAEAEQALRKPMGEMISIPGGEFRMGDLNGGGYDNEKPVRRVTVKPFKLGKYEVTFAQWDACVADGGCGGYRPDDEGWGRGNRPVINVSWNDVQSFIDWLNRRTGGGYRLPTEAEWEYAARAGSTTTYSWGNDIGVNRANCLNDDCGDQWQYTAPRGSFEANAWGLHDMHGNVREWVQDCYRKDYRRAPKDGSARTRGCDDNNWRVFRGGSCFYGARTLRSAYRSVYNRTIAR